MKLKNIIKNTPIQVKGPKDVIITGVCSNSKLVAPGNLFVARKGQVYDGAQFIPEAISAGASAILSDMYDPNLKNVTQLIHPNVRDMEAKVAQNYYQSPSSELFMVGITGTNGKTTTSYIVKHLLDRLGSLCGVIGTLEYIIGQQRYQAVRSTPDVSSNHKMLREVVINGCKSAVMEVTSHSLEQGRAKYIDYDVAIFTNLTVDHLDYHGTMDEYCRAKSLLFKSLKPLDGYPKKPYAKTAVVNIDSPWHEKILEGCSAKILSYGLTEKADLRASNIQMNDQNSTFDIVYKGQSVPCYSPLIGRFNVYNVLAAIGALLVHGFPLEVLVPLIADFSPVSGRLQPVSNPLNLKIFVDFAHSDDALINVLECLQEIKKGRIITVFGCGGDRDRTKRPKMAQASEEYSDLSIVTSDNPRSEDPAAIINEIVKGFKTKNYVIEIDRYAAIQKAIEIANSDDILLIAGKGHETHQVFAHKIIEFDDRKIAFQICQRKYQEKQNSKKS